MPTPDPYSSSPESYYLTGPTASGKSCVGIELARRLDAEIISLDSMALYRGMNIGTAKPSAEEQRTAAHHLIDILDPHEAFSLAQYVAAAERTAQEIRARGKQVLFVGGTPLYLKSLLRGIFEGPPADWSLRDEWSEFERQAGPGALHARLAMVDPPSADRLHPSDTRRIIRALEVFEKTGQTISSLQSQFDRARPAETCRVFVLDWPKAELCERIDARVDAMFAAGLVAEAQALLALPQPPSRTASQAVGYREVFEFLVGRHDLPTAISLVKTHTRQFAKRQLTWFRSLSECRWQNATAPFDARAIAVRIAEIR